ncbi:autotransporter domain-containing protein [Methylobacillus gramineus]|uniref:autotransporter outer membrane beta-barrel domain-containing protein n=1 Tax=Methylobacillus gramineus TaxID=755169 RepID=UPI001D001541|nr:autotransporter domain-containing protein [Methylobacillus gramineus]MCB5185059.1 autotransporter domain-containing protein [Methylobacillus gramineus]
MQFTLKQWMTLTSLLYSGVSTVHAADYITSINGNITTDIDFSGSDRLTVDTVMGINGGLQRFTDNSILNVSTTGGITGGNQSFYHSSALVIDAQDAITGGTQTFHGSSKLEVATLGSINSETVEINLDGLLSTFDLAGNDVLIGGLTGLGNVVTSSGAATLTVNTNQRGDSVFYGAILSGNGILNLVKDGIGTWNFSGVGIGILGTTTVNGGTLAVNGDLSNSQVTVNNGGILSGIGDVGETMVTSGGILAPSNPSGSLTVKGNLSFDSGSIFQVEVDSQGNSDHVSVSGQGGVIIINGASLNVIASSGSYAANTNYTILSAPSGINGTFSNLNSNLAFLTPSLNNNGNDLTLSMTRNNVSFADVAVTFNQRSASLGLMSLRSGLLVNTITTFDASTARIAYTQLAGEIHASSQAALIDDTDFLRSAVIQRLYQPDGNEVWFKSSSIHGYVDRNSNNDATSRHMHGGLIGIDRIIGNSGQVRAGLIGGYGDTNFNTQRSSADINSVYLGGYAGLSFDKLQLKVGTSYGYHHLDTKRTLVFGRFTGRESANYNAQALQAFADAAYRIQAGASSIEPFFNLAQIYIQREGFSEYGDEAALKLKRKESNVTLSTIGVRMDHLLMTSYTLPIRLSGSIGLRHGEGDLTQKSKARLNGGSSFDVQGNPIDRDSLVYDIGINSQLTSALSAGINYRGQQSDHTNTHAANLYLSLVF